MKLSRVLNKHHAMQTYERVEVWLYAFLTLVLCGGVWLASCSVRIIPKERTPVPIG
jgi:hypothetical protein